EQADAPGRDEPARELEWHREALAQARRECRGLAGLGIAPARDEPASERSTPRRGVDPRRRERRARARGAQHREQLFEVVHALRTRANPEAWDALELDLHLEQVARESHAAQRGAKELG